MERRIAAIEAQLHNQGCTQCRDWPALVIEIDPEPAHPATCPVCGREASQIVRIVRREDGPQ